MSGLQVLVLVVPDTRREDVIDALISMDKISGFTLTSAMGFSAEHSHFNLREQVQGCRAFARFEVLLEPAILHGVLDRLSSAAGSETSRYWLTDVPLAGRLPQDSPATE
ncbi:MAG: DUF3240 family protein [Halieaceae bacterium]|jgi:hypothetical protein|nr:DUF3240 family protein [Halieaceae bacterium]